MKRDDGDKKQAWPAPTRRTFVAMLGAAAAAIAVRATGVVTEPDAAPEPRTIWIGHC